MVVICSCICHRTVLLIAGDSGALFSFDIKNNSAPDAKYTASLSSARTTNLEGDETTLDDATFAIDAKHIYNLIYMVDGVVFSKSQVAYGATITPLEVPSIVGYTFSGWSEIPVTMPANDLVVTGSFSINSYVITYMIDDEVFKSDTIAFNDAIPEVLAPEREGYDFVEWSGLPEYMPANDLTVTAVYCKYDGIENSQYDNKYLVYDISGRFLGEMDELELGRLTPGVYIINGKKYELK